MKSQFPGLSESKQEANAHCHITSGCWFICWRGTERETGGVTQTGQRGESAPLRPVFFFFLLPYNKVWKDSLCIRLINSYSSSAWHLGNRSGFALGLIFRPVEDSQSIRALFRLHTTNFLDLPKKQGEKRKKTRVIEEGIDDIQGEMEGR